VPCARCWVVQKKIAEIPPDSEEACSTSTRLVDILRRAELWDEAAALAEELSGRDMDPTMLSVIKFQQGLIKASDTRCYLVSDAVGAQPEPSPLMC
jgi:hypothetical protein